MSRTVLALVLQIVLAVVVALVLGGLYQWLRAGDFATGAAEAAHRLFFFMDVGLGVWAVILIVLVARRRTLPSVGVTVLAAAIGVAANALTVIVVGLVQGDGLGPTFLLWGIEAGIAFLVAVLLTAVGIHRLLPAPAEPVAVKPSV